MRPLGGQKPKTQRMSYAKVIAQKKGKDYKKTIEDIKNVIQGNEASGAIKTIRQTKDGKILITTDKDE